MRIRNSFIALMVAIASLPLVSAPPQQPAPETTPKFSAQTELVLVPVIVRKGGAHLAGLKKEDFTLLSDNKPTNIAVFEEVHAATPTTGLRAGTATAEQFTNLHPEVAQRMTIIALDLVNTAPMDQAYLHKEIMSFLSSAAQAGEPFSLVAITRTGIHVLQDFTTDTKLISAAVKRSAAEPGGKDPAGRTDSNYLNQTPCAASGGCGGDMNGTQAAKDLANWMDLYKNQEGLDIFRDRNARLDTLSALRDLAQSLIGLPGRKTLVWASSGVPIFGNTSRVATGSFRTQPATTINQSGVNQAMDENAYTFKILSAANVAVYPLDARHGANTSFQMYDVGRSDAPIGDRGFSGERGRVQGQDQETISMFQQIAVTTGGKPCFNRTDLANCLKEFSADSHDYYMLGFYVEKSTKPGWHTIGVKLDQKADLRNRSGFVFAALDPEKSRMTDLQTAMSSPLPYTAVAITGHFTGAEPKGGKRVAHFELNLPPETVQIGEKDNALNIDIVAVARGSDGKEAAKVAQRISRSLQPQQAAQIRAEGIHYTNKLELDPGSYGVWFVVRDNVTGRTGSVMAPLTVQ
jgi:VWFA-related protein